MKIKYLFIILFLLFNFNANAQQDEFIEPTNNLIIDGIPKIPASLVQEANQYTEFRNAVFQSWHPSKNEMIILTRFGNTYQLHYVKFPGGARTQLSFFKERVSSGKYDPKNGNYVVISKDIGGAENYQFYRYDIDTGKTILLTDGKSRNTGGVWSNNTNQLAYQSTRRTGKDTDIWIMNPLEPDSDHLLIKCEGGGWNVLDWSPDDKKLLIKEYISINESYLWTVDVETGEKILITPKNNKEKVYYGNAAFSSDGKGIYLTTDLNSEFLQLAYLDLENNKYTYLTQNINWDIEEFKLSKNRSKIAYKINENGINTLHIIDLQTFKESPLPKLPVGTLFGLEWHPNETDIAFTVNTYNSPYDVYSINVKTATLFRWTYSETGGLNPNIFSEPKLIKWKSFDGLELSGFLYLPPATFKGKHPVIIDIHGGPEAQARPEFLGRYNYYINELGIAVILPNIRGSAGYGKTFLKLDNAMLRENAYKDIETLLDWIKTQPQLDSERIAVMGGSYGGHMTLAIATRYSNKIKCAISIVGISNIVTFLENTSPYRIDLRRAEYGDERNPKIREYLLKIAPINNADKIKKPLFIIQGANDPRVPLSEAEQMVKTLKKVQIPVWYLVAKDEGHGFSKKQNQDYEFYSTILFIKEFLLK